LLLQRFYFVRLKALTLSLQVYRQLSSPVRKIQPVFPL